METSLLPDEIIIRSEYANLFTGMTSHAGKLYLTNIRLIHEPSRLYPWKKAIAISRDQVIHAKPCERHIFNLILLCPTCIIVHLKNSKTIRFAIFERMSWCKSINTTYQAEESQNEDQYHSR